LRNGFTIDFYDKTKENSHFGVVFRHCAGSSEEKFYYEWFTPRRTTDQPYKHHPAFKTLYVSETNIESLKKYGFEFLSIFVAVVLAFALDNWNENRREAYSEDKILSEIAHGLKKDIDDLRLNELGHRYGISACNYFRKALAGKEVSKDSLMIYYFSLTRDFVSIQNTAGYETLKSKGLELVENDSLRLQIISLYEYEYNTLRKLEEEYSEMQFQENYFNEINQELAPNFKFDANQNIIGITSPLVISDHKKKILLLCLWKIQKNRNFILSFYSDIENKTNQVHKNILSELEH